MVLGRRNTDARLRGQRRRCAGDRGGFGARHGGWYVSAHTLGGEARRSFVRKTAVDAATLALALIGCDAGRRVVVFPVQRADPETHYGHGQVPLGPATYRNGTNEVASERAGILSKHQDWTVLGSETGVGPARRRELFRNARRNPLDVSERYDIGCVSSLEYNAVRCRW